MSVGGRCLSQAVDAGLFPLDREGVAWCQVPRLPQPPRGIAWRGSPRRPSVCRVPGLPQGQPDDLILSPALPPRGGFLRCTRWVPRRSCRELWEVAAACRVSPLPRHSLNDFSGSSSSSPCPHSPGDTPQLCLYENISGCFLRGLPVLRAQERRAEGGRGRWVWRRKDLPRADTQASRPASHFFGLRSF